MSLVSNIPVVLLAGGLGTRLREETETKPKPMVEIGGHPMLWHIMKHYAAYGAREFVICLGYKGEMIKDYFLRYHTRQGSISVDLQTGQFKSHSGPSGENWTVHLLETGQSTMTGGRVRRAAQFLGDRRFMLTYGDGVCDIALDRLLEFHEQQGRQATITAVRPAARFGGLTMADGAITQFAEKHQTNEGWINGGFMVIEPAVAALLRSDEEILERYPLETLAGQGQLSGYRHDGFWQCMDTVRDLTYLRELWDGGSPPWKTWT
jgi:glucose-1-phosphate cytidylyltransferase